MSWRLLAESGPPPSGGSATTDFGSVRDVMEFATSVDDDIMGGGGGMRMWCAISGGGDIISGFAMPLVGDVRGGGKCRGNRGGKEEGRKGDTRAHTLQNENPPSERLGKSQTVYTGGYP